VLLVVFIIFLPKGILGSILERVKARRIPSRSPGKPILPSS
jgi:branched-chain amino acid transport system permease protein